MKEGNPTNIVPILRCLIWRNPPMFDYSDDERKMAAAARRFGWCTLENRPDGLYATITAEGKEAITRFQNLVPLVSDLPTYTWYEVDSLQPNESFRIPGGTSEMIESVLSGNPQFAEFRASSRRWWRSRSSNWMQRTFRWAIGGKWGKLRVHTASGFTIHGEWMPWYAFASGRIAVIVATSASVVIAVSSIWGLFDTT